MIIHFYLFILEGIPFHEPFIVFLVHMENFITGLI